MVVATISFEGVLAEFLTPILPNIIKELTREASAEVHKVISVNVASVAFNLEGGRHGPLALTMTT